LGDSDRGAPRETDITVIGGGPAGATCALALARSGISVTLVHWDGYAPGGIELVSGCARQMLEQDSPGLFRRLLGVEICQTVSLWDTPEPVTLNAMFNPWGPGVALERSLLDQSLRHLARAAGASIAADTKATHIERSSQGWRLLLRSGETGSSLLNSRFVVIATGRAAGGLVERPPAPEPSRIALMMPLAGRGGGDQGHTLYIESADNGWWYALPAICGEYFAGFCTRRGEVKKRQGSLREFFIQELRRTRLLSPLLPGAADNRITGRTADASPFTGAAGDGWIAIGDAAYAPDPLSGMGIERAIESARLGAGALLEVMEGGGASARFAEYEDKIREGADRHGRTAAYHYGRL
jgi:flavin-dependent dehydrogenase